MAAKTTAIDAKVVASEAKRIAELYDAQLFKIGRSLSSGELIKSNIDPLNHRRIITTIIDIDNNNNNSKDIIIGTSVEQSTSSKTQDSPISNNYKGQLERVSFNYHGLGTLSEGYIGDTYLGEFCKGKKHGLGVIRGNDGYRFEGEWRNDNNVGLGVRYYKNGNIYEGQFDGTKADGLGMHRYLSGNTFLGEMNRNILFNSSKMNAEGDFNTGIGQEKHYCEDRPDVLEYSYKGEWKNGQRHGVGILKEYQRKKGGYYIFEGQFRMGKHNRKESVFVKTFGTKLTSEDKKVLHKLFPKVRRSDESS